MDKNTYSLILLISGTFGVMNALVANYLWGLPTFIVSLIAIVGVTQIGKDLITLFNLLGDKDG